MSGKAFKGRANSSIPDNLLESNVKMVLTRLGLSGVKHEVVGNKHQNYLGDIDLAVDKEDFEQRWVVQHFEGDDLWEGIKEELELLKTTHKIIDYMIVKGWKQFHVLVPLVDEGFKETRGWKSSGGYLGKVVDDLQPGLIQVDILVGNLDWMTRVQGSANTDSDWKALYRTNLLADAINLIETTTKEGFNQRLLMDYKDGIYMEEFVMVPPTGRQKNHQKKVVFKELLTSNPDDVGRILFGPFTWWADDLNSFEQVWELLNSKKFRYRTKNLIPILNKFKTRLEREHYPVPRVVMEKLGLEGGADECLVSPTPL